jgi:nucleotide-binding universal stress UspA family protein
MKRILLAYDGSEPSRRAADQVALLAAKQPASITVLVVGELAPSGYGSVSPVVEPEVYEGVAAEGLERVRNAVPEADARVVWGRPGEAIVEAAREGKYDLVVVGHRGKGGLATLLLGSVAKHVIDHAPCSVLVVR